MCKLVGWIVAILLVATVKKNVWTVNIGMCICSASHQTRMEEKEATAKKCNQPIFLHSYTSFLYKQKHD